LKKENPKKEDNSDSDERTQRDVAELFERASSAGVVIAISKISV
jgi:hypothetical protein